MKLIDKAKQAAVEGAVTKALEYLEKDQIGRASCRERV